MKTLIIENQNSELHYQSKALSVYCNGKKTNSVPVKELERVIVSPQVNITAGVLGVLTEQKLTLIVLNARFPERSAQLSNDYNGDIQRRIHQYQLTSQNHDLCLTLSTQLVKQKIQHQQNLLQRAQSQRPDLHHALTKATKQLQTHIQQLNQNTQQTIATLNGIEGAAAMHYFHAYHQLFADSLNFTTRNRRPPKDPVNAILSLSYTLLYHEAINALKIYGLDPALGFYHQPNYNRQSLACDLIEPVRPYLDQHIWRLFAQQTLTANHFTTEEQACFLTDTAKPIYYQWFFTNLKPIKRLLRRYALNLANLINQQP